MKDTGRKNKETDRSCRGLASAYLSLELPGDGGARISGEHRALGASHEAIACESLDRGRGATLTERSTSYCAP